MKEKSNSFSDFIQEKFGLLYCNYYENLANYIKENITDYTNIPYNKVYCDLGCSRETIDKVVNVITEYEDLCAESPEEQAIQNIRELLGFLEKKIKGKLGKQEQHSLEENTERWKEDIVILRNYIEQEAKSEK